MKRLAIVGGTHGNEWLGLWVAKKFQQQPKLVYRSRFETIVMIGNPGAVLANRRYLDRDLNRCFDRQDLANPALTGYENGLAKEIAGKIGASGTQPVDGILDLHTTTSNMGITIVPISHSLANLRLAAYLVSGNMDARIYMGLHSEQASPMLRSLAPVGCTIEVGPIAQGILDAKLFQQMAAMVLKALDYFEDLDGAQQPTAAVTLYQATEAIDYPRNGQGEIQAMIHPDRQGQDYQPMAPGDPLFLDFEGQTLVYEGSQLVYPAFINEAAYYEKGIAAILTEKREIAIG